MIRLHITPLPVLPFKPKTGWAFRRGTREIHYYIEDQSRQHGYTLCSLLVPMNELENATAAKLVDAVLTQSMKICTECKRHWRNLTEPEPNSGMKPPNSETKKRLTKLRPEFVEKADKLSRNHHDRSRNRNTKRDEEQ